MANRQKKPTKRKELQISLAEHPDQLANDLLMAMLLHKCPGLLEICSVLGSKEVMQTLVPKIGGTTIRLPSLADVELLLKSGPVAVRCLREGLNPVEEATKDGADLEDVILLIEKLEEWSRARMRHSSG